MRVLLTGGSGLVGSSIKRLLDQEKNLIIDAPTSRQLDLLDSHEVNKYFDQFRPEILIHCAARVGGVWSNSRYPAKFSLDNLTIQTNVANSIVKYRVQKTINLSSSCVYPKNAAIPLVTSSLMTGPLEETNRWYAIAKLSMISALEGIEIQHGLKSVSILPTNIYGPNDNFHLSDGHVVASLLIRAIEMKRTNLGTFSVWGTGDAMRELIYVDDLARAVLIILHNFDSLDAVVNVGSGQEYSIREIAKMILLTVKSESKIEFDSTMPNGVLRKPLNSEVINSLGWSPEIDLQTGLQLTHDWIMDNFDSLRKSGVVSDT
jgi:GDP-L-fucose synthase